MEQGNIFHFLIHLGSWRTIQEDGITALTLSIEKNGVLEDHLWFVMEQPKKNKFLYHAIDGNHRCAAYKRLQIKKAKALVFPPLDEETYAFIAGKFLSMCI